MEKLESQFSKEAAWRSRLLRQAQSGKTIAAFCRDESVSTASFHIWRSKLAAASGHSAQPHNQQHSLTSVPSPILLASHPWTIRLHRRRGRLLESTLGLISAAASS